MPTYLHIVARRRGTGPAVAALREGQEAYVGDALALRARLAQRLDELQCRLTRMYRSFDGPGAAEVTGRIAAVTLAIEELDALICGDTAAASG